LRRKLQFSGYSPGPPPTGGVQDLEEEGRLSKEEADRRRKEEEERKQIEEEERVS
jgi:hypothetical protein